jgi:fructokinase
VSSADILCWGEILWDHFPDQKRLGGAPANVAYHLATLGAHAALVSRVGDDDDGREAVRSLQSAGVDGALIQVDPRRATGRVTVTLKDGEPTYTMNPGGAWEHIQCTDRARQAARSAKVVCYGTLSQRLGGEQLFEFLDETAGTSVCDLNLRPQEIHKDLVHESLRRTAVVKLNQSEHDALGKLFDKSDVNDWLLGELACSTIALTRGSQGCVIISRSGQTDAPSPAAAPGGDHVGAGDAFVAVLALGTLRNWSPREIADKATRYASFVASKQGATPAVPAELIKSIVDL